MTPSFDTDKFSIYDVILNMIKRTLIVSYGIIYSVTSDTDIEVTLSARVSGDDQEIIRCFYLMPSSSLFRMHTTPVVGDHVLILSLKNFTDDIFTATDPVQDTNSGGYSYLSAIAIPVGIAQEDEAKVHIDITDDTDEEDGRTTIGIDNDLIISSTGNITLTAEKKVDITLDDVDFNLDTGDGNITVSGKGVNVTASGTMDLEGNEIDLNGSSDALVLYTELNTQLQTFITKYNTDMASILAGATAAVAASGYWLTPLTSIGSTSLDISSAETTTIKTGG